MNRNLPIVALLALFVMLVPGCAGLQKMKKNAAQIRFKVTPEVLENRGGTVEVAINGIFPEKYFDKKATLVAVPILRYETGETPLSPVALQGEKVKANNREISYLAGGNFSYQNKFPFSEPMLSSDLEIRMKASRKNKTVDLDPVVIAKGILATNTLMADIPKPILGVRREPGKTDKYDPAVDPFQRVVPDEMIADILYLINSAQLRDQEIKSKDVKEFLEYTKEAHADDRKDIKKVEISAYASPDGSIDVNLDLASKREKASTAFLEEQLKKASVETNLRSRYTPEDWEGFREMLENSNIQDKELILRVLSMYNDPEVREREMRNLSAAFTQVAEEILPKLRRAKLLTSVNILGKTDEEVISVAEKNPSALNQAELLYAATLTDDPSKKLALYESFSHVFPSDWRGWNNQAAILIGQQKFGEAKPLLERAEQLRNNEPIIKNNLGTLALVSDDLKMAEEYFGAATGSGNEVSYNLALAALKKGDYNRANQYFRNYADINTALVKLLSGNYNGAINDLEEQPACFRSEYLKAVAGARTGNEKLMLESLRNAIGFNPAMKERARKDMEFARYADVAAFRALVE